ncbi:lipoate--protein ligase [Lactonifactor sp. BIOML-A4]|uniref:lipoate--protein ligase n=1 Tax=unclassified Lactonifactor TaxID=2636670 RepID=UPI00325A6EC4
MGHYYYQTESCNPWYNLAVETYLGTRIQKNDVILYLWQNDKTVVIGKNQNALLECRAKLLEEEGGFLARRTTGGGAVYQDLGNLCFTFLADPEVYDLERQMKVVTDAIKTYGLCTEFSGRNDLLAENGCKFSGNAFSNTGGCRVHHGTLMVNVNLQNMERYLTPSPQKLRAKGVSSVRSRVCNLRDILPGLTVEGLKGTLIESFCKEYGSAQKLKDQEFPLSEINRTKEWYAAWEWRYGKSPECGIRCTRRFAWGGADLWMKGSGLRIQEIKMFSDCLDTGLPQAFERLATGKRLDMGDVTEEDILCAGSSGQQRERIREVVSWLSSAEN